MSDTADARRAELVKAYDGAKARGDMDAMAVAALELAGSQVFGTLPGRLPAFLHEAYTRAEGPRRVELAVAIARAWAYGGYADRALPFVEEALAAAEAASDPRLLAQALDARLLVLWGPDDLDERLVVTERLEDVVAHIDDVELQMSAYLWRLTTALEWLDVPAMRRQLRALDQLADDTGSARVRFFAASRRAMHALLVGDLSGAERARLVAVQAGTEAGEPDTFAIEHQFKGTIALQGDDVETMLSEAQLYEEFALGEGVVSVGVEAARLWVYGGDHARAERLLHQLAGADFGRIARDVDWLLSVTGLTEVAAVVGATDLCANGLGLLTPYAGRGVVNAGAVGFVGVVDHYLAVACDALGRGDEAAEWRGRAAEAYRRFGAGWWLSRCSVTAPASPATGAVLAPTDAGVWRIGRLGRAATVKDMRGLHYLRILLQRPGVDITARELSDAVAGNNAVSAPTAAALPVLDRRALAEYRRRLTELDDELAEAGEWSDEGRVARLAGEREALLQQLRSATGLGGRVRTTGGTDERFRVAVRKAIAAAIARVGEVDASLGRLLTDTVSTGAVCRYQPDPDRPIEWVTVSQG